MNDSGAMIRKLFRQQAAIAGFGSFALRENDLLKVLTEAAKAPSGSYRSMARAFGLTV
jgi:hypothetical protein